MSKRHQGINPDDFGPEVSLPLDSVINSVEVNEALLNSGYSIDQIVDAMYDAGMPGDLIDTILSEFENKNGTWN
jgi:hypothetical protein